MSTRKVLLLATAVSVAVAVPIQAQEVYYDLDITYGVTRSDAKIALQFDPALPEPQQSQFFGAHPCLDATVAPTPLHRGFRLYSLGGSCGYAAAATDLLADPAVKRVVPVYITTLDSAEFRVTDLIDVQFTDEISQDSGMAILASYGLHFVDSNTYRHNLWECALNDTVNGSPLAYGNTLHLLPETEWACARQYDTPVLQSLPADNYFVNQYYLVNTGQNGGIEDVDIDADSAWMIPLSDSSFAVAVLDDGVTAHLDIEDSRIGYGYDFAEDDYDCTPGAEQGHGMACASIIAGSVNDTGIVGIFGSCSVLPVRIFGDSVGVDTIVMAEAIRYAARNARVVSNSWTYRRTTPIVMVANAIRDASRGCGGGLLAEDASLRPPGAVFVFSAGNYAENPVWDNHIDTVTFPGKHGRGNRGRRS